MKQEINTYNIINLALWSLIGILGGILLGNLMGLSGKELIFPAVVGLIALTIFAYRQIFDANETTPTSSKADEKESTVREENVEDKETLTKKPAQNKMGEIDGVIITPLQTFPDDRGYFREIFRLIDSPISEANQLSATMSYPGVIKAFHYHKNQDDLWYCAKGMIQAVMYDLRPNSRTYGTTQVVPMGDLSPRTLFIPRGVVHGYKVLGPESAMVIYATTQVYDPNDELRIPHDDEEIGFDWDVKPR